MNLSLEQRRTISGYTQVNWMYLVNKGGRVSRADTLSSYSQYHPYRVSDFDFQYVESGRGRVIINGTPYPVRRNEVILIFPEETFDNEFSAGEMVRYYLHFTPVPLTDREGKFSPTHYFPLRHFTVDIADRLQETFSSVLKELTVQDAFSRVQASCRFTQFMLDLQRNSEARQREQEFAEGGPGVRKVMEAKVFIEHNFMRPLSVANIAVQYQLNADYFARLFRRLTGFTPYNYIVKCRIDRAKMDLIEGKKPIKEIAETLCFSDVHHFTRVFHRWTGKPPGQFARRIEN